MIIARRRTSRHARAARRDRARRRRSRRRSVAGATTSTRSCSAGRPSCRGRSRSTSRTGRCGYAQFATFHPTFLYESMWCLLVFGTIVCVERHFAVCARVRRSRSTSRCTRSGASSSSGCAVDPAIADLRYPLQPAAVGRAVRRRDRLVRPARARRARADRAEPAHRDADRRSGILRIATRAHHSVTCTAERAEGVAVTTTTPPTTDGRGARGRRDEDLRRQARPRCARSTRRRRVRARRVHRDHGPVGLGQVDAAALPRRSRLAHERPGVPRRHRPQRALREGAHAGPPRPHRLRLPDVQPHPDAHRAREHHAADGARGPASPTRRGSTASSTPSACASGSRTGRRSSRAVSSSASPSRARSRAGPRSSSPTSRPATSTRAPSAEILGFMQQAVRGVRPDDRDGHARPDRGGVREPRRLPRRRPDRRRAPRPAPPTPILDKMRKLGRRVTPCGRSPARGSPAHKLRFVLTALAVDPRRRVHVRHARAHRDDPADVRRPLREHLPAAPTRSCAATKVLKSDFGTGPAAERSRVARRRRAARRRRVDGRRRQRPDRLRADRRHATARPSAAERAADASGFGWDPNPKLNQFHLVAGHAAPRDRRRDRDRQAHRRQGQLPGRRPRRRSSPRKPPRKYTIVGIAKFGTADSLAGASIVALHAARGAARRGRGRASSTQICGRRQARRVAGRRSRPTSRTTLAAHGYEKLRGDHRARRSPRRTRTRSTRRSGFLSTGAAGVRVRRAHRRHVHHLQHVLDRRRAAHRARWRCSARSERAGARCSRR